MIPKDFKLGKGAHNNPEHGACVMEVVSLLAQQPWTDQPTCTNSVITSAAQRTNDQLNDKERQKLKALIPRILRARRTENDKRINVRLAIWCARRALHLVTPENREKAEGYIAAAERWLETGEKPDAAAYADADAAARPAARAAAAAAAAADAAAAAAAAADAAAAACAAAAAYAVLPSAVWQAASIEFLSDLLDAHEKALVEEGEALWVPADWEDEALAFAHELAAEVSA